MLVYTPGGGPRVDEERYRLMFEANPMPMWVFDSETLAFLAVNDAAVQHYGYSRAEFMAMSIKDIRPPEDVGAMLDDVAQHADLHAGVWRHVKKDGTVIRVEVTAHSFLVDGRATRLVIANDVTERLRAEEALRQTESQLRQAQKMEAVGRLAGGVAHDFNNMLSVILSYAHLIAGALVPGDPMRADAERICEAGERAAELTRRLLMFSRQKLLEPRIVDVNEVLAGMEQMARRILREDIDLQLVPAPDPIKVKVDPGSFEQVMLNLIVNARDAMPRGGRLSIRTTGVELDEAAARAHADASPGAHVLLAITDTGTGMDLATQARVFEPFFTTKPVGKGTGLGLSSAFGFVQQSGGRIWVDSEPGRGTTFYILLPRAEGRSQPARTTNPPPLAASRSGSETILLVEDDDEVRAVAAGILHRHGYHLIEARNAGEALLHCERHAGRIHLLLSDVVMPQMSGPELARRLAGTRPDMKVLCMSGYADDQALGPDVLDGQIAFLQKPITPAMLTRRVREVLDSGS
jgi:two-component system, cell cycle sensor histidine kinase and response regulator CckA